MLDGATSQMASVDFFKILRIPKTQAEYFSSFREVFSLVASSEKTSSFSCRLSRDEKRIMSDGFCDEYGIKSYQGIVTGLFRQKKGLFSGKEENDGFVRAEGTG